MKLLLITLLSFFSYIGTVAQVAQTALPRDVTSKKVIDSSTIAITYRVRITTDTLLKSFYMDNQILEIGNKHNRYYSAYAEEIDSVKYKVSNGITKTEDGLFIRTMTLGKNEDGTYEDIITNFPSRDINTVYTKFLNGTYIYKEPIPTFEWSITGIRDTVMAYECHEATTSFRGRNYRVWFTLDIPISAGPWKLNGLPGLILRACDTDSLFQYTAIGIAQRNKPIYMYESKAIKCDRKDVIRLNNLRWANFDLLVQTISGQQVLIINNDGKVLDPKGDTPRYIPQLELE